ncbi:MAG: DUF4412 domain-containing protein [Candidatus Binatia bacterium]
MRQVLMAAAAALLLATGASAFEGTIKLRTTAATADQLKAANGGKAPDDTAILAMTPAQLGKDVTVKESTVYVSGSKVRMDMPLETKGAGYAVVDLDKGLTWFVVPGEKRYIEWSEADAKAIGEKMAQMKKMMQERMASLPPDQRKQVEAMMKNMQVQDEGTPQPTVAITPLGKQQTIHGMSTTGYSAKEDQNSIVAWVTSDQPDLNKALLSVSERMEKLTPANMRRESVRRQLQQKGLPVMVQNLSDGRYRVEEIVAIDQGKVDAALFDIPKDFARTTGRDALKSVPGPGGPPAKAPAAGAPPAAKP